MDQLRRDVADLRVVVGRLDVTTQIGHERIAAAFTRLDGVDRHIAELGRSASDRMTVIDGRLAEIGYHLKTAVREIGDLKPTRSRPSARSIEIWLPVVLLLLAVLFRVPIGDIVGLIPK